MFLTPKRFLKTPRRFASNAPTFFKNAESFFINTAIFFKKTVMFFEKTVFFCGNCFVGWKIKSWIFTLHTLHSSRKMVNGEGCEG